MIIDTDKLREYWTENAKNLGITDLDNDVLFKSLKRIELSHKVLGLKEKFENEDRG